MGEASTDIGTASGGGSKRLRVSVQAGGAHASGKGVVLDRLRLLNVGLCVCVYMVCMCVCYICWCVADCSFFFLVNGKRCGRKGFTRPTLGSNLTGEEEEEKALPVDGAGWRQAGRARHGPSAAWC